jgi:hypothetical protein
MNLVYNVPDHSTHNPVQHVNLDTLILKGDVRDAQLSVKAV